MDYNGKGGRGEDEGEGGRGNFVGEIGLFQLKNK